jgi:hypothetical protein
MDSGLCHVFGLVAVINLPDHTDRKREAEKTLQLLGMAPELGRMEFFAGQRVSAMEGFPSLGW